MQLLDSLQNQMPNSSFERQMQDALEDIVSNVQIKSNFYNNHPDYKPLELSAEVVARFQQLPTDLQNKYLRLQLRNFLYGIYYNGNLKATLAPDANSVNLPLYTNSR